MWQPALAAPCESETHTEEQTEIVTYSDEIELSELYPVPGSDEEEFIELYNGSEAAIDLAGWILADASNKAYALDSNDFVTTIIDSGDYFVIPHSVSKIFLNNGGDSVALYSPDESLVDSTTYDSGESAHAWAFVENEWQWTGAATEGSKNKAATEDQSANDTESEEDATENTTEDAESESADTNASQETSSAVLLSELLPNPEGLDTTDEWIEIVNTGTEHVYLGGWTLTDETTYYTIEDLTIAPSEYIAFEVGDTKISLNNSGDTLFLIDPFGTIINGTAYEAAEEGHSWAMIDGSWSWTSELTPGEENTLDADTSDGADNQAGEENASTESPESAGEKSEAETDIVSIDLFKSLDDKTVATVTGVVSVLPGTFGSQYFYMQDESAGIQVYSYSKAFPDLSVGDRIQVTGEKSVARGETRIKVSAVEQIVALESGIPLLPRDASTLDESLEGLLVQVEGEVVESSSKEALIDDLVQLVFKKSADIDSSLLEEGTAVTVLGIVTQYDDEYRVQPRSNDDIQTEEADEVAWVNTAEAAGSANPDSLSTAADDSGDRGQLLAIIGFILLAIVGIGWTRLKPYIEQMKKAVPAGGVPARKNTTAKKETQPTQSTPQSIFEQLRKPTAVENGSAKNTEKKTT